MVCHLSGTGQLGALTKEGATKRLEWNERDRRREIKRIQDVDEFGHPITRRIEKKEDKPPENYVANASELFKRLSRPSWRLEDGCGGVISITEEQGKSFKRLHKLRNQFSHFSPMGWSIELELIEEVIDDILDVLCSILDDPWPFRLMPEEDRITLRSRIEEIRSILANRRVKRGRT